MGSVKTHPPVLTILAVFSQSESAIEWARNQAAREWGPVAICSEVFDFQETDYYQATMGAELRKQFFAFERLMAPERLAEFKRQTNQWETTYIKMGNSPMSRPLNLDPGYLSEAKLILASTKDHAHRVYLCEGIYAEVTLHYSKHRWQHQDWTYPDYRRTDYHRFFDQCRTLLREHRKNGTTGS